MYIFLQTDASVGTEMGTMTEPDCIGPLDPGTSVTLEGIVWHETDGGKRGESASAGGHTKGPDTTSYVKTEGCGV